MTNPAFPDALPALSRLHWYVVERVLGQGGFGITYLARDTNLDQPVAVKEYLPVDVATRMADATIRSRSDELRERYRWGLERFMQEARILARFDHANIVRVLSVFEFNNTAYMVMRFEQGVTLSALLDRRGTLPERELLRIILPILDGLDLVHNAGFIHRDIKPDNIHIGDDGNPVLLDFGSARQSLGNSHTLTILIAPGYAPFEQYYSDSTGQGPWTDIYGLGATCYRAIAGRAPMDAVSRSKGILGSVEEVMVPASIIGAGRYSGKFLAAIDHALAFAEKDRPQSIASWRQELVAEQTPPAAATEIVPTPPTEARPRVASPDVAPIAARTSRPGAVRGTAPPAPEPRIANGMTHRPNARSPMLGVIAGAMIVTLGIGAYLAFTHRDDEIAALQKQVQDKERAEVERSAKLKADEDQRQRKLLEQQHAEQQKTQDTEAARKRENDDKARVDEAKRRDLAAAKTPAKDDAKTRQAAVARAAPPATGPVVATPAVAGEPVPTMPAVAAAVPVPSPANAPEPAKTIPPRSAASQLADADRAIAAKQYDEALGILKALADTGNSQAQSRLGTVYAEGQGVTRDYATAERWYEKAALQGETVAELKLGAMYATGTGVARNNYLAYVWYGTAARLGSAAAKPEMEKAAESLQPAERQQADRLIESKVAQLPRKP